MKKNVVTKEELEELSKSIGKVTFVNSFKSFIKIMKNERKYGIDYDGRCIKLEDITGKDILLIENSRTKERYAITLGMCALVIKINIHKVKKQMKKEAKKQYQENKKQQQEIKSKWKDILN